MQYVDVIDAMYNAINQYGKKSLQLNKVYVYGRISHELPETSYLQDLEFAKGKPVLVELIAIECETQDYFTYQDVAPLSSQLYAAQGTIVALAEEPTPLGEFVKIRSKFGGVNIRFGLRNASSADRSASVNCLNFWKNQSGGWVIFPNEFESFDQAPEAVQANAAKQTAGETSLRYESEAGFRIPQGVPELPNHLTGGGGAPIIPWGQTSSPVGEAAKELKPGEAIEPAEDENAPVYSGAPMPRNLVNRPTAGVSAPNDSRDDPDDVPKPLVNRENIEEKYPNMEVFTSEVERTSQSREEFLEEIKERQAGIENVFWRRNAVIMGFHDAFVARMYDNVPGMRLSRKTVVQDLAEKLETKRESKPEIVSILESHSRALFEGSDLDCADNPNYLFAAIVDCLIGTNLLTRGVIRDENGDKKFSQELIELVLASPYDAAIVYGLSVLDADKIFFLLSPMDADGWFDYDYYTRARDALIVKSVLDDESAPSSLVEREDALLRGVSVSPRAQTAIKQTDRPFEGYSLGKVDCLVNEGIRRAVREGTPTMIRGIGFSDQVTGLPADNEIGPWSGVRYSTLGWLKGSNSSMKPVSGTAIAEYMDEKGIAVEIGDELISAGYLKMEDFVYRKTYEMGSTPSGVQDNHIERALTEYEAEKGFKLEDLQRQGVNIVKSRSGILSGQAGSGKTTVSEAIVKALKYGLPEYEIMFAAPTGKAARRMKEVLGDLGEVRTLHSLFGIGIGGPQLFDTEEDNRRPASEDKVVYILDEMAMCTTNLLYQVLTRIAPTSMVFYLGDVKQLPPIGKGMPFRNMLNYMPAIELGVSKRAKDGSGINSNCDRLNQKSFSSDFEDLEPADDFKLVPCNDNAIVDTVLAGVRNNVKKMSPDDIQVATPYATPKKPWSSTNLNPALQDIFLPDAKALFTNNGRTFRKGARAIHVKKNIYGKKRYFYQPEAGILEQSPSRGVVNGEVGKIIDVVKASSVNLIDDQDFIDRTEAEEGIEFVDDAFDAGKEDSGWYVLLEVDDPDINEKVVILYKGTDKGAGATDFEGRDLRGTDLGNLELAYALTVHKLQGSQAKMVIIPLSGRDNANFVSRNMVYTAISRAQETVVLVGSVSGGNSMLNASRRNTSVGKVRSVHSVMSGVKEIKG